MGFNATGPGRGSRVQDITLFLVMLLLIGGLIAWAMGAF